MATKVGRLGFDLQAPFRFQRGDKVAWKRQDGTPDSEFQGTITDGTCEYTVGGGAYQPPVYVVRRDDSFEFAAAELSLVKLR